ncbi:hypothetical protein [Mucilaginibacter sp.]|uniref:hypothetical protein n=1 Tax=Mucilaginibacter sp. TaxID=1882438 RepID=UPI0035BBACD1
MAKEIKVIQCPKCGSTQKVELKPDYFQCQNCNTGYFLDNNDININHNYNHTTPVNSPAPVTNTDRLKQMVWTAFVVLLVLFAIARWAVTCNTPNQPAGSVAGALSSQKEYNWWHQDALTYIVPSQKLISVVAGQRDYMGDNSEKLSGAYVSFYDLLQGKELKGQRLTNINSKSDGDYKMKSFANGDIYIYHY